MDRNFYYQKRTEERRREISQALAARHLLRNAEIHPLAPRKVKLLALRIAPAVIVITLLLLLGFLS